MFAISRGSVVHLITKAHELELVRTTAAIELVETELEDQVGQDGK